MKKKAIKRKSTKKKYTVVAIFFGELKFLDCDSEQEASMEACRLHMNGVPALYGWTR